MGKFDGFKLKTSNRGGRRYMPYAFTEHGVTMLANLLRSETAINMSIAIVRAFIMLRQMTVQYKSLEEKIKKLEKKYNRNFKNIYEALTLLLEEKQQHGDWENREKLVLKNKKMPEQNRNKSSLGEFGLIEHLTKNIELQNASSVLGVGDDAAVIDHFGKQTVITTDLLVEGVHFDLAYTPLKHLGYKSCDRKPE